MTKKGICCRIPYKFYIIKMKGNIKMSTNASKRKNKLTTDQRIRRLVVCAMLMAIIIIMGFTPLGFIKIGIVEITFLTVPVVIGAATLGWQYGGLLGGVFGTVSFIQCFGLSPFGATLLAINPFLTFVICLIPRVCIGIFAGLLFDVLKKHDKTKILSFAASTLLGAVTNTVLFVGFLLLFFGRTEYIQSFGSNVWNIIVTIVGFNGLIEIVVCTVVATALSKVISVLVIDRKN